MNEEVHKANINGARTWEDLDDETKTGEWKVEAFFGKVTSSKGWELGWAGHSRVPLVTVMVFG